MPRTQERQAEEKATRDSQALISYDPTTIAATQRQVLMERLRKVLQLTSDPWLYIYVYGDSLPSVASLFGEYLLPTFGQTWQLPALTSSLLLFFLQIPSPPASRQDALAKSARQRWGSEKRQCFGAAITLSFLPSPDRLLSSTTQHTHSLSFEPIAITAIPSFFIIAFSLVLHFRSLRNVLNNSDRLPGYAASVWYATINVSAFSCRLG